MAAITNAQVKQSVDGLIHRFDLFEQKEETRHQQLETRVGDLEHSIDGNAKEGMKTTVKTLKDDYDKRCKDADMMHSANLSLRNTMIALIIGQVISIALIVMK